VALVGALVASSTCMVGLAFARDPFVFGALALAMGFSTDTYRPAMYALVADLLKPEDRLRAYAHLYWASNLGFSVAPVVAGLLASRGYFALFMGDAATTFAFAVLAIFKIPETLGMAQGNEPAPRRGWRDLGRAFGDPVFMTLLAVTFPLAVVFFQFQVALPAEMTAHGATPAQFGTTMALNGFLIVVLQPLMLEWLKRFRRSRTLAAASLFVGVGFGLNAFFHLPWQYSIGVVFWTLGEIAHAPVTSSLVADLAPADARGRYQGAYFMVWALASSVAPLMGGWLHDPLGPWFWGLCFLLSLAVAAAHLAIAGQRKERLAALRGGEVVED
jgi:MFS family permease